MEGSVSHLFHMHRKPITRGWCGHNGRSLSSISGYFICCEHTLFTKSTKNNKSVATTAKNLSRLRWKPIFLGIILSMSQSAGINWKLNKLQHCQKSSRASPALPLLFLSSAKRLGAALNSPLNLYCILPVGFAHHCRSKSVCYSQK